MYKYSECENIADCKKWDEGVLLGKNPSFYQSTAFAEGKKLCGYKTKYALVEDEKGNVLLRAVVIIHSFGIYIHRGPICYENGIGALNYFFVEVLERYDLNIFFSSNILELKAGRQLNELCVQNSAYHTMMLKIESSFEKQMAMMNQNRRRIVRKVLRKDNEFVFEQGKHNLDLFLQCMISNNNSLLDNKKLIPEIVAMSKQQFVELYVCKFRGQVISGIMAFVFGEVFESRYNTNSKKYMHLNAGTFLDCNILAKLIEDGIQYYDFAGYDVNAKEGVKEANINYYKRSYGGSVVKFNNYTLRKNKKNYMIEMLK